MAIFNSYVSLPEGGVDGMIPVNSLAQWQKLPHVLWNLSENERGRGRFRLVATGMLRWHSGMFNKTLGCSLFNLVSFK